MSMVVRLTKTSILRLAVNTQHTLARSYTQPSELPTEEFRVLNLKNVRNQTQLKRKPRPVGAAPPRTNQMAVDQDWASVWPGTKTFHPASVPLPIRQGYNEKGPSPAKYGNAELMKIPNFLHLTPPAIRQHCAAISKFCTPWPKNLETDEKCRKYFPIQVITSDYCHSSPTIRDPMARIVSVRIQLADLPLNAHACDKIRRLVGDRYNEETGYLTIVTDRCPTKVQNYEYAMYILTAVFHEAWAVEPWEAEKSEEDMEYFDWEKSKSKQAVAHIASWSKENQNPSIENVDVNAIPHIEEYKTAVTNLLNNGESDANYEQYANATRKLLNV